MKFDLNTESINYLKITYKDKEGFAHCIKAAVKYLNDFELLASAKYEENLNIETPQEIELGIACENGLYKATTILKHIENNNPYLLFSMSKPDEMEYHQNREYFRVKLQENVNIVYEENGQEKWISAITYDISANGVRVETEKIIDFPENVKIILHLPQRDIELQAKYVRTDNEDQKLKLSFHFVNVNQTDLDYIFQICFAKQLEDRRKNLL